MASVNLALRTYVLWIISIWFRTLLTYVLYVGLRMALWGHNRWVNVSLLILILGHWSLILQGAEYRYPR